ncbi:hypothetical protein [Sphingopyxis sp. NFH-91]|uniref:hypothetical protein n=1 Tax=Sphingopyxis sp. NFH-91 TaxID=2744457 RepID=UPI001F469D8B|nr:hypothetical protein [Sphingopyxis sp. NFH-91]
MSMPLAQQVFIAVVIFGAIFHIFSRRAVDFLSASFFGLTLYFLPGFIGFVLDPYLPDTPPLVPLIPETYWVFCAALVGNIVFSIIYRPNSHIVAKPIETSATFDLVLSFATIVSLALAFAESGSALLDPDKNNVLASQGRFWILFSALSQICAFVGVASRRTIPLICGLGTVAFAVFVGFRSYLAVTGVAMILYYVSIIGTKRIFSLKTVVPAIILIFFVFIYKQVYIDIKYGEYARALTRLSDPEVYVGSIKNSEPFATQAILNTVLMYDYRVPFESLISVLLSLVPFLSIFFDLDPRLVGFNFQEILFPGLEYGLASNIYANFYGLFGMFGIFLWIILHNAILMWFSKAIYRWSGYKRIPLFLCGSLMCFYVIRSDLVYNISSFNRIIYTFLGIFIAYRQVAIVTDDAPRARIRVRGPQS